MSGTKYWKGRKFKVESKVNISNQKANTGLGLCEVYEPLEMRYGRRFDSFHFYTIRTRNGLGVTLAMKQENGMKTLKILKLMLFKRDQDRERKLSALSALPAVVGS